ncbi:MAG: CoA-binding protein [Saprospiraceae bacterium]|nr:CoA-binding protein [Saprospiraceae bacterium]
MKKTVVLGATPNPSRYAYLAAKKLRAFGHEAIPVGIRKGEIEGVPIQNGQPDIKDVDTVTLYLNPEHQRDYYDYIFSLQPKRVIFNPGTENPELMRLASEKGIETEVACTLVLLSVGNY